MSRGGFRPGAGRKPVQIDLVAVEKLSTMGCSDPEIAAFLGVSPRTVQNRYRKDRAFARAIDLGWAKHHIHVRRLMLRAAERGDSKILLSLAQQLRDELESEKELPFQIVFGPDDSKA